MTSMVPTVPWGVGSRDEAKSAAEVDCTSSSKESTSGACESSWVVDEIALTCNAQEGEDVVCRY